MARSRPAGAKGSGAGRGAGGRPARAGADCGPPSGALERAAARGPAPQPGPDHEPAAPPELVAGAVLAGLRAFLAALPAAVRGPVVAGVPQVLASLAGPGTDGGAGGTLAPGEAAEHAETARELLSQDERVRAATAGWAPERLQALLRCFFEVVLARLRALEGTDFGSEEAKRRAIAGVVKSAIAEVARDPAAWMRVHCGEPRR